MDDFELPKSTPNEDAKSERLLERFPEPVENSGARITLLAYCFGMLKATIIPMTIPATAKRDKNRHCFSTMTHNFMMSISLIFFSSISSVVVLLQDVCYRGGQGAERSGTSADAEPLLQAE
jgi:hypothetical protein